MSERVRPVMGDAGFLAVCVCVLAGTVMRAEDWPRHRGPGGLGVWNETGIIETFPPDGLPVRWRTPLRAGYRIVTERAVFDSLSPAEGRGMG